MLIIIKVFIFIICILIFYQDLRYRSVTWILFPLLCILLFCHSLLLFSFKDIFFDRILINILISAFTALGIISYFFLKRKKYKITLSEMIGWGDLLFFLAITPFFSPLSYCIFIILGSTISIVVKIIYDYISNEKSLNIPLAGNLALLLSILIFMIEMKILPELTDNLYILI